MSIAWKVPKPEKIPASVTRIANPILILVGYSAAILWFWASSYADWLRFSNPVSPNPSTGKTVFVKAIKGAYYTTPHQAWFASGCFPFIWGSMALAGGCYFFLN